MPLTVEQLAARQDGLGASDAGAYCGVSKWKSALQLYLEKRGEIAISAEETEQQYWGKMLEEPVCERWAELTGFKIRRAPVRSSKDLPYFRVNMDRTIISHPRGPGYLEAKNLEHSYQIKSLAELPEEYYLQMQHGLFVTGYAWGAFAIRAGGRMVDPEAMIVDRDQETIDKMVAAGRFFWEDLVLKGVLPDVDGSESAADMLAKLYPKDDGREVTLTDPIIREKMLALQVLKSEYDAAEAGLTAIKNRIKWYMNDASVLHIPEWGAVTWKKSKDRLKDEIDLKKLREEFAAAYAACVSSKTMTGARVFLMKPDKETL